MAWRYAELWFFMKGASPPHFTCDFLRKLFLMLSSINCSDFFVWLPLLLEILGNMCIETIFCPGYDIINFKINRSFLIKSLTKKTGQKFKYLKNKKCFSHDIFFVIFKSLSLKQTKTNFLEAECPTLSKQQTLDADPKPMQEVDFAENLDQETKMFFIIIKSKLNSFGSFTRNRKIIVNLFCFNKISIYNDSK